MRYSTELVELAKKYLGYPSVKHIPNCQEGTCTYGTTPDPGFDCSGLPLHLLRELQFPLPNNIRHTREFFNQFGTLVHSELRQPGDLVFFSRDGSYPSHMGIMVSDLQYIHAPGKGKPGEAVVIKDLQFSQIISKKSHSTLYVENPIGFKRLAVVEGTWSRVV